jgi:hypothetical protein
MLESWVTTAERDGVSLCHIAIRSKRHPSACYRLVKGLTGLGWEEVRVLGTAWVQNEFSNRLRRCGRLVDRTRIVGAQHAAPLPDATAATAARSV